MPRAAHWIIWLKKRLESAHTGFSQRACLLGLFAVTAVAANGVRQSPPPVALERALSRTPR